jgi:hypothetical protein
MFPNAAVVAYLFAVGVVEEGLVSQLHAPHNVTGLIVAHTIPTFRHICASCEIVDGELVRLALHQVEILRRHWWFFLLTKKMGFGALLA